MPDSGTFLAFAAASLALLAVPGPSVLYIVARSVEQGRRAGIVSMLGIEAGGLLHVAAAALGLSALMASSAAAFEGLRWAGAAYLVWLGARKLLAAAEDGERPAVGAVRRLFWHGVAVNLLNPKTAMFFLAFLPQFVDPAAGPAALQALVLGLCFLALAVVSDGAYALAASAAGRRLVGGPLSRRRTARLSGAVYLCLGAATALAGARPKP